MWREQEKKQEGKAELWCMDELSSGSRLFGRWQAWRRQLSLGLCCKCFPQGLSWQSINSLNVWTPTSWLSSSMLCLFLKIQERLVSELDVRGWGGSKTKVRTGLVLCSRYVRGDRPLGGLLTYVQKAWQRPRHPTGCPQSVWSVKFRKGGAECIGSWV